MTGAEVILRALNEFSGLMANNLLRGGARVYLYPAMTHVRRPIVRVCLSASRRASSVR